MRSAIALLVMPIAQYLPMWVLRLLETPEMRAERRAWKRSLHG